jgi:hypothetical protein
MSVIHVSGKCATHTKGSMPTLALCSIASIFHRSPQVPHIQGGCKTADAAGWVQCPMLCYNRPHASRPFARHRAPPKHELCRLSRHTAAKYGKVCVCVALVCAISIAKEVGKLLNVVCTIHGKA